MCTLVRGTAEMENTSAEERKAGWYAYRAEGRVTFGRCAGATWTGV